MRKIVAGVAGAALISVIAWRISNAADRTTGEYGHSPILPAAEKHVFPTPHTAKAVGWVDNSMPAPAQGLRVLALARGLEHPRWLYVLPNGDVLVAESDTPTKPDDGKGIRGAVQKLVMASGVRRAPERQSHYAVARFGWRWGTR